jgi:signal transduction histidine kinase
VAIADNNAALHLYRIAQEAVNNAIKHGKAQHINVALTRVNGSIRLTVRDDGTGFPKESKSNGIGLRVMNYRAGMIGASLTIQSSRETGTLVSCQLPDIQPGKPQVVKYGRSPKPTRGHAKQATE